MAVPAEHSLNGVCPDLEQRLQALERSNAALEHFAHDASHDLAEPLRVMAQLARRLVATSDGHLGEEERRLLAGIVDGVDRMRMLISDLLECSVASEETSPRQPVDCGGLLTETLDLLQDSISEKGATVTHGKMPVVESHNGQLGQVFQNLISNALKFADDGVQLRIYVDAHREPGAWRFSVQDNGIGVDPEEVERVFERFCRLNTRDTFAGTGIGLSICRRIVARHGGRIWVEPALEGGSVFYFTIPDSSREPATTPDPDPVPVIHHPNGHRSNGWDLDDGTHNLDPLLRDDR